jgi:hypothetical protein
MTESVDVMKIEAKLAYNREWQRMKYQTDPEWRRNLLEANKRYYQKKKAEAAAAPPDPNKRRPGRPRTRIPPTDPGGEPS